MTEETERERAQRTGADLRRRTRLGVFTVSSGSVGFDGSGPFEAAMDSHSGDPAEVPNSHPDPGLLPDWVRERGFRFESQESLRVIRVRKGAAKIAEKELIITLREGDGVPAYSIMVHDLPISAVDSSIEKLFTEGEMANTLWRIGFDEVIVHTMRCSKVDLDILHELAEPNVKKLHIFGGAIPNNITAAQGEHHNTIALERSVEVVLTRKQRQGFITAHPNRPMFSITDERGNNICIGSQNYLMVMFNIFGGKRGQLAILSYSIRKWLMESSAYALALYSPETLNLSHDEVVTLFHKLYDNIDPDSPAVRSTRDAAKYEVSIAFDHYRDIVRKYAGTLRFLEGVDKPSDEIVAQRAETTFKGLAANPLLSGFRVFDNSLKVVTKPLRSQDYWSSTKRLLITLPLYYRGDDRELKVHELHSKRGLVDLPYKEDHIFENGAFCLGSLARQIDTNMLIGEWNMAVLLILRGLLGQSSFRQQLDHYKNIAREVNKLDQES